MTDAAKPPILVAPRLLTVLAEQLEADYAVHRFWAIDDRAAFLAGPGRDLRAVVGVGEDLPEPGFLRALPALGLIACTSTGYETVELDWCREHRVAVVNGRSANAPDVAEHAVGLVIAGWRGIVQGDTLVRAGQWRPETRLRTHALRGRRVGIVGLGAIGLEVARLLAPFNVQIAWWAPRDKPDAPYQKANSVLDLARDSDILVVAARADAASHGLIGRAVIEALGPQGLLVNVSRGVVLDEDAVIAALKDGRLGGAALDVFQVEPAPAERWADTPTAILTPHHAGSTFEARDALWSLLKENLRRFYAGEPLATPVV